MSDVVNPYKIPEAAAIPEKPMVTGGSLTETMLAYLKAASPWLRFVGILGFVGSGSTVLAGISFLALIPLTGQTWGMVPGFESLGGVFGALFSGGMMAIFVACGALMFFPSLFSYRFGEKIRAYLRTGSGEDLEQAFKNNKSLWKFYGIVCIVYLAFIPIMIIAGVIIGVMTALV